MCNDVLATDVIPVLSIMYTELTETDLTNNPLLADESIYYDEGKNKLIR